MGHRQIGSLKRLLQFCLVDPAIAIQIDLVEKREQLALRLLNEYSKLYSPRCQPLSSGMPHTALNDSTFINSSTTTPGTLAVVHTFILYLSIAVLVNSLQNLM